MSEAVGLVRNMNLAFIAISFPEGGHLYPLISLISLSLDLKRKVDQFVDKVSLSSWAKEGHYCGLNVKCPP